MFVVTFSGGFLYCIYGTFVMISNVVLENCFQKDLGNDLKSYLGFCGAHVMIFRMVSKWFSKKRFGKKMHDLQRFGKWFSVVLNCALAGLGV